MYSQEVKTEQKAEQKTEQKKPKKKVNSAGPGRTTNPFFPQEQRGSADINPATVKTDTSSVNSLASVANVQAFTPKPVAKTQAKKAVNSSAEKQPAAVVKLPATDTYTAKPQAVGKAGKPSIASDVNAAADNGGAGVALSIISAPASTIAKDITRTGEKLSTGFNKDAASLTAATPKVESAMKTAGIEAPEKKAAPQKVNPPKAGTWAPTTESLRSDTPTFTPTSDANPQQVEAEAAATGAVVGDGVNQLNNAIVSSPGEERVQAKDQHFARDIQVAASEVSIETTTSPEIDEYMAMDMPEDFRKQVDSASNELFQKSLEEPRNLINDAKAKRELDHTQAVQNSEKQAKELEEKANSEQAEIIAQSRNKISEEKDKSLAESKTVLDEFNYSVDAEKQSKLDEIDQQIAEHEKQADVVLVEADEKVAAEQQKADQKKADVEKEASDKKEDKSWLDQVGDFISDIGEGLVEAVTSIIDALAELVKEIIEKARSLANSIIEACAAVVKGLLDAFATVVKAYLDVALAAFPEIRDKLNAAIDMFVEEVNQSVDRIADKLQESVNAVCDTLTSIVNAAQNAMVSAIKGAMMMFNAIASGNFADLPRIAFMTACETLGLPGDALWGIVLKAKDQAMEIIKNPIDFLVNLIEAGGKGFGQFVDNIKQHLINGLMGWLMGQVSEAGITLPEKFDGPGIFLLVRQILGITYEYVRERAVTIIGEENVERLEAVFNYLKVLFTEGPEALFAQLKEKAVEVKDAFIAKIEDWAITAVIQKAILKATSMLIPGAGFVQAIFGMWETFQFFLDNVNRIAAVVNSVLDSIGLIAKGILKPAADFIEKTMVETLPLVFSWLAKLIGIDGIGEKIKFIIDTLRTPVNTAVDFVVKGAANLVSSGVDRVRNGPRGNSEANPNGPEADASSSSDQSVDNQSSMSIEAILAQAPTRGNRNSEEKQKELDQAAILIRRIVAQSDSTDDVERYFPDLTKRFGLKSIEFDKSGDISIQINPKAIIDSDKLISEGDQPPGDRTTDVTFTTSTLGGDVVGKKMEANAIGPNHPLGSSTSSSNQPTLMAKLETDPNKTGENKYIRGHLLNDNIGGPGDDRNLFPITASANSKHLHEVEKTVKDWVNTKGYWVYYKVEVKNQKSELKGDKTSNFVNAEFDCLAYPLTAGGKAANEKLSKTIKSEKGTVRQAEGAGLEVTEGEEAARDKLFNYEPERPSSSTDSAATVDANLLAKLRKAYAAVSDGDGLKSLLDINGIGDGSYHEMLNYAKGVNSDIDSDFVSRINGYKNQINEMLEEIIAKN